MKREPIQSRPAAPRDAAGHTVTVRSKDGKHTAVIQGTEDAVGVWLHDRGGVPCVSLMSSADGPTICFHHNGTDPCPLAFALDPDGRAFMQVGHGDHVHFVDLHELVGLAERVEALEGKNKKAAATPAKKK